jgi:hypothetical protein
MKNSVVGLACALTMGAACGPAAFPTTSVTIDPCPSTSVIVPLGQGLSSCADLPVEGGGAWKARPRPLLTSPGTDRTGKNPDPGYVPYPARVSNDQLVRRAGPKDPGTCVFEWEGAHPGELPSNAALDKLARYGGSRDCTSASASGLAQPDGGTEALQESDNMAGLQRLSARHTRGLDTPSATNAWAGPGAIVNPGSVRVAVVDATPLKLDQKDTSLHGYSVSQLVGSLACPSASDPGCKGLVLPYLALPRIGEHKFNYAQGGYYGTLAEVENAITSALNDWNAADTWNPGKGHLIINLSLGWDPIKFSPDEPGVKLVEKALQRAFCLGALVIASAGNVSGSEGPIWPAALEAKPGDGGCEELGLPAQMPAGNFAGNKVGYRPLVYAVGAVDSADRRLAIMRPWGTPRLTAYGQAVPVVNFTGKEPHAFSGTSMAAAVVSGIAARVWSMQPKLDAHEVMQIIYEGGATVPDGVAINRARTDFCMPVAGKTCVEYPVHRATLCGALRALKQADPGVPAFMCVDAPAESLAKVATPMPAAPVAKEPGNPCGLANCGKPMGPLSVQIPPAALPQPTQPRCPTCRLGLQRSGDWDLLRGTISYNPPIYYQGTSQGWQYTYVRAWNRYWQFQDYYVYPVLDAGTTGYFSRWVLTPYDTQAATHNWVFFNGASWETFPESLTLD